MQGSGTIEDPYLVATAEDLDAVRNDLTAYYLQTADIDLGGYENWEPIGPDGETLFSGSYDGQGHTVSGIR